MATRTARTGTGAVGRSAPPRPPAPPVPARTALLAGWLDLADRFAANWFGPEQAALFAEVDEAVPTLGPIRVGASAAESRALLSVLVELWPYLTREGLGREAEEWMAAALRGAGELVDADIAVRANWVRAWLAYDTMMLDRVDDIVHALETAATEPRHRAALSQILGIRALYEEDPHRAHRHLIDSHAFHRANGSAAERFVDLSFLAATASALGDRSAAYDYCEQTLAICDRHDEHLMRSYVIWAFALSAWRAADRHRAYVLALDGAANAVSIGDHHAAAICTDIAAWYEAAHGDPREAGRLLGFAEALRLSNRLPSPYLGTDIEHRRCVDAVLERIGADEFGAILGATRRTALADVGAWIAASADPGQDPSAPPRLTPRQQEIASLIAEGLTNKEIARRLLITVSTVETHIEHIFRKLDVVSRAQVAAWAASQRLPARRA
ncbi:response regulator transcription factor [Leucobacter sp.]